MAQDFVRQLISRLFSSGTGKDKPFVPVTRPLVRGDRYKEEYGAWLDSADPSRLCGLLRHMYDATVENPTEHTGFRVYRSPRAEGFYADESLGIQRREFSFLLDYFRDGCLALGYRISLSDSRYRESEEGVVETDRHLLKPDHTTGRTSQEVPIFGNIAMENVKLNDQPDYIKLMVTRHSGRHFAQPRPFGELMDALLGE